MRYAETVAEVGLYPLRRRDRAAMVLALHVLRCDLLAFGDAVGAPFEVLHFTPIDLYAAVSDARSDLLKQNWRTANRLLRARLALLLRVLLRVDAGDFGGPKFIAVEIETGEYLWHLVGGAGWRPLWEAGA